MVVVDIPSVTRKGRNANGARQTVEFLAKHLFEPLVFCDASIQLEEEYTPVWGKIAYWNAESMEFSIERLNFTEEEKTYLGKQDAVFLLETKAIQAATQAYPGLQIFSDNRVATAFCRHFGINSSVTWIPRELNVIANNLAKHSPKMGKGYIAFNATTSCRGWLDLIYED